MKKILLALLFVGNAFVAYAQKESSEKQIIVMLKSFYTKYIVEIASSKDTRNSERVLDSLRKRYCTKDCLKRYADLVEQTDSDPFIKAQDSNIGDEKTISIKKGLRKPNLYIVSYIDVSDHIKRSVKIIVIEQNGSFKINSIR
jgi:hypothetical protein